MAAIPERLNSWIALGANVGVLVGLALLVVEINQNNVLVRAQIEQSRSQALVDWRRQVAMDDGFSELMVKILALDPQANIQEALESQFTPAERVRVIAYVSSDFFDFETLFGQYQRGLVSEDYWQERAVAAIRQRGALWKKFDPFVSTRRAFREEVDRILEETENNGPR